jgi:5-methylcytosine-specific restriction endonuclease McrA
VAQVLQVWLDTGQPIRLDTPGDVIRRFLMKEQDSQCALCGLPSEWNGRELQFIMDHVNGDSTNSSRENLRLICPNCDSQLDTYKGRNVGNGRHTRRERYRAGLSY